MSGVTLNKSSARYWYVSDFLNYLKGFFAFFILNAKPLKTYILPAVKCKKAKRILLFHAKDHLKNCLVYLN